MAAPMSPSIAYPGAMDDDDPPAGGESSAPASPAEPQTDAPEADATAPAEKGKKRLPSLPKMPKVTMPSKVPSLKKPNVRCPCRCPCRSCWCPTIPSLDIKGYMRTLPYVYCQKLAQYPWVFHVAYVILIPILVGVAWQPIKINTDLESFRRVDAPASIHHTVFQDALLDMRAVKNGSTLDDRRTFEVELFYEAKVGSVFEEACLRDIRTFEHKLRQLPGWVDLCNTGDPRARFRCEPGESIGNYVWPTRLEDDLDNTGFFKLNFEGLAKERLSIPATLAYLGEGVAAPHEHSKFLPAAFDRSLGYSGRLRSLFAFTETKLEDADFEQKYKDFVENELYPMLRDESARCEEEVDPDSWDEPMTINIYFRGREILDYEVRLTLVRDMGFATCAFLLALALTWFQLQSLFLASVGLLIVFTAVPLTYIIVRAVVPETSLVSFLSIFVVFGLGTNVLLTIADMWRRSRWDRPAKEQLAQRVEIVFRSSVWRLMPMFFTAAGFFVMLSAVMRPMREFGMFTGICMLLTMLLTLVFFLPTLVLHERVVRPFVFARIHRKVAFVLEPVKTDLHWKTLAWRIMNVAKNWKAVLGATAVLAFVATISAAAVAATRESPGLPEVFSPSHQQNAGRPLVTTFSPTRPAESPPPPVATVCHPGRNVMDGNGRCALHWCEAPLAVPNEPGVNVTEVTSCPCHRTFDTAGCTIMNVTASVSDSTASGFTLMEQRNIVENYIRSEWPTWFIQPGSAGSSAPMTSLVLEHWESGLTDIVPFFQLPPIKVFAANISRQSFCQQEVVCHCGERKCALPVGNKEAGTMDLFPTGRRLDDESTTELVAPDSRRLNPAVGMASAGPAAAEIIIMYGIVPPEDTQIFDGAPKWKYDDTFDAVSPWAQRAMLRVCEDTPASFIVISKDCWILGFRSWLLARGEKFPVQRFGDFNAQLRDFMNSNPGVAQKIWMDSAGNMRATMFTVVASLPSDSEKVLDGREKWLEYIKGKNDEAATTASKAWPTSQSWVDAEAYVEALASAWNVVLLTIAITAAAGVIYMFDAMTIGIITAIAAVACSWMAFWMFCMFGWAVGPWEVIILTVFMGYSIEPAFYIGRDFVKPSVDMMSRVDHFDEEGDADDDGNGAIVAVDDASGTVPPAIDGTDGASGSEQPRAIEDAPSPTSPTSANSDAQDGDDDEALSDDSPSEVGEDPKDLREAVLRRSVYLVLSPTLGGAVKLILCAFWLLPCEFRLFTRLGAVAIMVPILTVPCTLIILPTVLLHFGRSPRDETDCVVFWKFVYRKTSWMWT